MTTRLLEWLGGRRRVGTDAVELCVISAWELLQARREAQTLARADLEEGLCLNACVLSRAARRRGKAAFSSGQEVLQSLSAEEIGTLAERYAALCQRENPSCCQDPAELEALRGALRESPYERLKWRVLSRFGVLPSEPRARAMTDGDYLYCVLQMMLDEEDERSRLCPECRAEAEIPRCPGCGAERGEENAAFDAARYEELKQHGIR
jgi:hypothetical protein